MLVRLWSQVQEVLPAVNDRPTTTFDFGEGSVESSTFSDIDSSADRVIAAEGSKGNVFEGIRHEPWRTDEGINWAKVGALAGVVGAGAAVLGVAATVVLGIWA